MLRKTKAYKKARGVYGRVHALWEEHVQEKDDFRRFRSSLRRRFSNKIIAPPTISSAEAIQEEFKIDPPLGFRVFDQAFDSESFSQKFSSLIDEIDVNAHKSNIKKHLHTGLYNGLSTSSKNEFLEFILQPALLNSITHYLGELPKLYSPDLWVSEYAGEQLYNSQLLHCDHDAISQIKAFIYLSDVDYNSGPLSIIPANKSAQLRELLDYSYKGKRNRVTDKTAMKLLGKDCIKSITGKAGTVILADTSRCFHFGSRVAPNGKRKIAMYSLMPAHAFSIPLFRLKKRSDIKHSINNLDQANNFVLN